MKIISTSVVDQYIVKMPYSTRRNESNNDAAHMLVFPSFPTIRNLKGKKRNKEKRRVQDILSEKKRAIDEE